MIKYEINWQMIEDAISDILDILPNDKIEKWFSIFDNLAFLCEEMGATYKGTDDTVYFIADDEE